MFIAALTASLQMGTGSVTPTWRGGTSPSLHLSKLGYPGKFLSSYLGVSIPFDSVFNFLIPWLLTTSLQIFMLTVNITRVSLNGDLFSM